MTFASAAFAPPEARGGRLRSPLVSVGLTFATLGSLTGFVLWRNPMKTTVFPACPVHSLTGGWCPGCGATRASYLLLHGHVLDALRYNALWTLAAPFVVYALLAWASESLGRPIVPRLRVERAVAIGLLAAIGVFFVARNLPGLEGWLSPPGVA